MKKPLLFTAVSALLLSSLNLGAAIAPTAYLKASNTDNTDESSDNFGHAVGVAGETLVASAPYEDSNATGINGDQTNNEARDSGAAYVFVLPTLVVSSLRTGPEYTRATSVDFAVTFSEAMTGVDENDFSLTVNENPWENITGASITGVSGGPVTYTVSVDTGSGEGTLRLNVLDDGSIVSLDSSEPLGGPGSENGAYSYGQSYTIDRTAFNVSHINLVNDPYKLPIVDFEVYFEDSISLTGPDVTDFQLVTEGVTGAHITNVICSSYCIVSVDTGVHIGTVRLDVVDDDTITDLAGNPLGGPGAGNGNFSSGPTYEADRIFTLEFNSTPAHDGWVLETSENSNIGGEKNSSAITFRLGDDALNRQYRAILSFNTASLPDGAVIQQAELSMTSPYTAPVVGKNPFNVLGKLWADIRTGPFGIGALEARDFNAKATSTKVGYFVPGFGDTNTILNATGRSRINKTGITQFRLYFEKGDNNNRRADFIKFVSHPSVGTPPTLRITYQVP